MYLASAGRCPVGASLLPKEAWLNRGRKQPAYCMQPSGNLAGEPQRLRAAWEPARPPSCGSAPCFNGGGQQVPRQRWMAWHAWVRAAGRCPGAEWFVEPSQHPLVAKPLAPAPLLWVPVPLHLSSSGLLKAKRHLSGAPLNVRSAQRWWEQAFLSLRRGLRGPRENRLAASLLSRAFVASSCRDALGSKPPPPRHWESSSRVMRRLGGRFSSPWGAPRGCGGASGGPVGFFCECQKLVLVARVEVFPQCCSGGVWTPVSGAKLS